MITKRAAAGPDDLLAAEAILTRAWLDGSALVASHPGDLEWWFALAAPDGLGAHLRLWDADGDVVAWSWVHDEQVHWEIHDRRAIAGGEDLLHAILTDALGDGGRPMHAWTPEDDPATIAILERLGFRPESFRLSQFHRRLDPDTPVADAAPPVGYRIRHMGGDGEIADRVAIHRAAFPMSRLTVEHYGRLMTLPHYRLEDDLVIEAPDGTLAAFAMAWWDPVAQVGEFEPVGTHPDHRRRGLGRALLSHGSRRYRDLGAVTVQIYSHADNPASEGLYQAVGFGRRRYRRRYERPAGGDVRSMR